MVLVAAPRVQIETKTRALAAVLGCMAAGCNSDLDLIPPLQPDTEAVLFIVESEGQVTVEAIDPSQVWRTALTQQGDLQLTTLLYNTPLSALGLQEGMQALAEEGIPLPIPDRIASGNVVGSEFGEWSEGTVLPPRLEAIRLKVPTPLECVSTERCHQIREDNVVFCAETCQVSEELIEPPAPPELPNLSNCAPGWTQLQREGLTFCEPWPEDIGACPPGLVRFVGESACAPLSPCPAGPWPENLPQDAIYVSATAQAGGQGTLASPYARLSAALNSASNGATIALSEGAHQGGVVLDRPLTLVGACAERTSISGDTTATLSVTSTAVTVRGARISGGRQNIQVNAQGVLHLQSAELNGATFAALEVLGGEALGTRVSIRAPGSLGLQSQSGKVLLRGVTIAPVQSGGLRASGGTVTLEDFALLGEAPQLDGALWASEGAQVHVRRALIQNTRGAAVQSQSSLSLVELNEVLIRNLVGNASFGLRAFDAGEIAAKGLVIDRAQRAGVVVDGGIATVDDFFILRTIASVDGSGGWGAIVENGGAASFNRGRLKLNRAISMLVIGEDSFAHTKDLLIEDTLSRSNADDQNGSGIAVAAKAELQLDRVRVLRSRGIGFAVQDLGSLAILRDLEVSDTLPRHDGSFGRGLEVSRAGFTRTTRGRFLNNRNISVFVVDEDSRGNFLDLHIARTTESDQCIGESCVAGVADGLVANLFAQATAERFLFEENLQNGFRVINGSSLLLKSGLVRNNMSAGGLIGVEGFNPILVSVNVEYEGNVEALIVLIP